MVFAVIGSIMGYVIVTNFIQEMPFWKYFVIELCITFFHELYNQAKKTLNPA